MEVINNYSQKIEKEKNIINRMYRLDYVGADKIYDGKIHVIALGYSIDKNIQYEEAKKHFYTVVDDLLLIINKDKKH